MSRKLIRVGLLMTIASVLSGALGYVFQVLMGRMLSPQDFALFAAIMSAATVMTSPISAVFTVVSRNITQALVVDLGWCANATYKQFGVICLGGAIILMLIAMLLGSEIGSLIKNSSNLQALLLAAVVSTTSMGMMNNAYLQGGQKYSWLAVSGFSTVILKIFLSVALVWIGFGVDGALVGTFGSTLIVNVLVMFLIRSSCSERNRNNSNKIEKSIFKFDRLPPVLIANVAIAVMTQLDVLLVNNFFNSEEAGKYAAAATLGKAILYLPGGVVVALFPMVAEAQAKGTKVVNYMLSASGLTLAMCLIGVLFYWLAGHELILCLFGENYAGTEEILKYYSLAMLPMALLIVAEYFLMALGKVVYAWLSFIFAPLQIMLIYYIHESIFDVIAIFGICGLLLLMCGYLFFFKTVGVKKVSV